MDLTITARHSEITEAQRVFAREKVQMLEHLWPRVMHGHLIIDQERKIFSVELNLGVAGHQVNCRARHRDIPAAIEAVVKKAGKRLRKLKTKSERRRKRRNISPAAAPEIPEDVPRLIKEENFALKTLSEREASLQMRASNLSFFVFRESGRNRPSIIYRRSDGNLGLIELE